MLIDQNVETVYVMLAKVLSIIAQNFGETTWHQLVNRHPHARQAASEHSENVMPRPAADSEAKPVGMNELR